MRLNKYIASSGAGSRRTCDQWIQDGDVILNGKITTNPAVQVEEDDSVLLRGKLVTPKIAHTILLNKPRELVTTKKDELERPTIYNILPPKWHHLNHVGRLDQDSEGLLLLTNDGELAQKLSHPSHKIEKEYYVTVHESFSNDIFDQLLDGVYTPEGKCHAIAVHRLSGRRLSITLDTGLKRQIRLMMAALHLKVTKLVRIRIGSLVAPKLELGKFQILDQEDIEQIFVAPKLSNKANTLTARSKGATTALNRGRDSKSASKKSAPSFTKKRAPKTPKGRK